MSAVVRSVALLVLVVLVAACPGRTTRKTLTENIPKTGDAEARSRFLDAQAKFKKDGRSEEFKRILEQYPNDPIAPWAELYAGIDALKARNYAEADKQLAHVIEVNAATDLTARAELYLGITKNYEGDTAAALPLLAKSEHAIIDDEDRTEWLAASAFALSASPQPYASLKFFDAWWSRANPTERAVILGRVEEVVAGLPPESLGRIYDELADRRGPSIAIVGSRLILVLEQRGERNRAAELREDIGVVRAAVGLPRTITEVESGPASGGGNGDPSLLAAVLPLGSATQNTIAQLGAEGLALAAGAPNGQGVVAVELRAGVDATTSAQAIDDLARINAVAVVGPIDNASVDAAAPRAEGLRLPMLTLSGAPEGRAKGQFIFHIRHSAEARARVLANRALAKGIKTFAVLAPENGYGKAVSTAFVETVEKGGGKIIENLVYAVDKGKLVGDPKVKSNTYLAQAGKLGKGWDAVFVPDTADNLALVATTLHAKDLVPKPYPFDKKKLEVGRRVLLLSTAEGIAPEFLKDYGRHTHGALLAPGYYPDDADPTSKPFIERYVAAFGRVPTANAAYAYDAAQLAVAAGQAGRTALAAALAKDQLPGVTGTIKFDAQNHLRADDGLVYTVVEETTGFAIRIAP